MTSADIINEMDADDIEKTKCLVVLFKQRPAYYRQRYKCIELPEFNISSALHRVVKCCCSENRGVRDVGIQALKNCSDLINSKYENY